MFCRYGYKASRKCMERGEFWVAYNPPRILCSHHAAIADALGWTYVALDEHKRPIFKDETPNAIRLTKLYAKRRLAKQLAKPRKPL